MAALGLLATLQSIPTIDTARLRLRALRMSDFDAFAANLSDPVSTQYFGGVLDRKSAWRLFAASTGAWLLQGAGWWAIEQRENEEVVGTVGAFVRESLPDLELGWALYRSHWHRGFGREAAAAALDVSFRMHKAERVIAHIDVANIASVRIAESLGMQYETDVDLNASRVGRYAITLPSVDRDCNVL